jgi:membrane-associated protease RseP (regulator of RpoE activity)
MDTESDIRTTDISEKLLPYVSDVMDILDVTSGGEHEDYAIRFRGTLSIDSEKAFNILDSLFADQDLTLLFREEGEDQFIIGMTGTIPKKRSNPWINLILFLLTVFSMLIAGTLYGYEGPVGDDFGQLLTGVFQNLARGIPFTIGLLSILLAHEFGHYLAARYNKTEVTLPYFLPFPGSLFGTLGAFIRLKEPPKNKRGLLQIGIAGPIAGFIVAVPVLILGLSLSEIGTLPPTPEAAFGHVLEGNSIFYIAAKYVVLGELLPSPIDYGGVSPLLYWGRYLLIGSPIPYGGRDVLLNPLAWAGWAGLLITALNLIPAGQLDGGHIVYTLIGDSAKRMWPFIVIALLLMGFVVWEGWYIWAMLIFFMGRSYAKPRDEITELDSRHKVLAMSGLVLFILVFMPLPLITLGT